MWFVFLGYALIKVYPLIKYNIWMDLFSKGHKIFFYLATRDIYMYPFGKMFEFGRKGDTIMISYLRTSWKD